MTLTLTEAADAAGAGRPVLIAGPTGSGKSGLALAIAARHGGTVVNADALQCYAQWRALTARPTPGDEAAAPHALYGHLARDAEWSVGHWLRAVAPLLEGPRPIVVGGTGLYLTALTGGLAEIPAIPREIRDRAAALDPDALLAGLDPATAARIDRANPARLRRAWAVRAATGHGLAHWQDRPAPPLLPAHRAVRYLVHAPPEALNPRLARRFDAMLAAGALDEVRAALPLDPARPADRAIGAPELAAHLTGATGLDAAREAAIVATRRYAKRQRTWFRARMAGWTAVEAPE